jgi:hypothetical protein
MLGTAYLLVLWRGRGGQLLYKLRDGRHLYCHLNFDVWREVTSYVAMHAKFWAGRLDELEAHLNDTGAR